MIGESEKPKGVLLHFELSIPHIQKHLKDIVREFSIADTAAAKKSPALRAEPDFGQYAGVIEEEIKPIFMSAVERKVDFKKIVQSDDPKREAVAQGWRGGDEEKYGAFEKAYFDAREVIKQQRAFPRLKIHYEDVMNDAAEELRNRLADALEAWAGNVKKK